MSYTFKTTDVYDLARSINAETKPKGRELNFKYCPFCDGGRNRDKYTFSVNTENGAFKCLRSSCSRQGGFITLAKHCGFHLDFGTREPLKKPYKRLPPKPIQTIEVRQRAVEYLRLRGISESTARIYGITTQRDRDNVLVFPFYDWNGELIMMKFRNTDFQKGKSNGSKEWTSKDTKPLLFGIQNINYDNDTLIITEGQIDSLSLSESGIENALSVPNGKNAFEWINTCWEFLHKFKKIIVFGDNENGKITLVDEINAKIKKLKIFCVRVCDYLGEKDANDILLKHGKNALINAVKKAEPVKVNHIVSMADVERVDTDKMPHFKTGIKEIDATLGGFYSGQYILLTGKRGEGKSTLLSQFVCEAIDQNYNTLVYSGELPNCHFKNWLDLQLAGHEHLIPCTSREGRQYYKVKPEIQPLINEWYRDKLFIMDNSSLDENENFFDILEQAIYRYNIKFLCLDNLMTITDYNADNLYIAQSAAAKRIKELAVSCDITVLLVAHKRKNGGTDENDNVSGSGDITNRADAVIVYSRKKDENEKYDGYIEISKNRLFGQTRTIGDTGNFGAIGTYFDPATRRIKSDLSRWNFVKCYNWESSLVNNNGNSQNDSFESPAEPIPLMSDYEDEDGDLPF